MGSGGNIHVINSAWGQGDYLYTRSEGSLIGPILRYALINASGILGGFESYLHDPDYVKIAILQEMLRFGSCDTSLPSGMFKHFPENNFNILQVKPYADVVNVLELHSGCILDSCSLASFMEMTEIQTVRFHFNDPTLEVDLNSRYRPEEWRHFEDLFYAHSAANREDT